MLFLRSLPLRSRAGVRSFSSAATTATFDLTPFKGHRIDPPKPIASSSKDELLKFYRTMTLFRRVEIVADTLYKQRLIRGFCHLYDGQEAVLTGMESVLTYNDSIITSYREHCHQISRGDSVANMLGELMGKKIGCSKGKGGSMHMYMSKNRFYGGNGIVGAQLPLGAGLAFAHKYNKDGGVAVAAYGDGAANQGQLYEAANMAALWKLPVIFLCENNNYGMGTSTSRASANTQFYTRGDVIPGLWIDGMDVLAVKAGFEFAANHCRSGKGPMFVECSTYRYHGHSMSDPGISYRSREEVANVRAQRDPIENVKAKLLAKGWADEALLKSIDKEVRKEVEAAEEEAKNAAELPEMETYTEIYVDQPPPFTRTVDYRRSLVQQ